MNIFRIDFDLAVAAVEDSFRRAIDGGCNSACYHLAVFYWQLSYYCQRISKGEPVYFDSVEVRGFNRLNAEKEKIYYNLFREYWQKALDVYDPRAMFDEAVHEQPWVADIHRDPKHESRLLGLAVEQGYPLAIYRCLDIYRDKGLFELLLCYPSVRMRYESDMASELAYEEVDDSEPNPKLSDFYDDMEELELNTRGDGLW